MKRASGRCPICGRKGYRYQDQDYTSIKVGDEYYGQTIASIAGASKDFLVVITADDQILWETNLREIKNGQKESINEFNRLRARMNIALPEKDKRLARYFIADALFTAWTSSNANKSFEKAQEYITTLANRRSSMFFLLGSSVLSIITLIIGLFIILPKFEISNNIDLAVIGGVSGSIGAMISVLQRHDKLKLDDFTTPQFYLTHGSIRILLGVIFGTILVIAVKADLVAGITNERPSAIILLSLVAGFNERFIPDLLNKLQSTKNKS